MLVAQTSTRWENKAFSWLQNPANGGIEAAIQGIYSSLNQFLENVELFIISSGFHLGIFQ